MAEDLGAVGGSLSPRGLGEQIGAGWARVMHEHRVVMVDDDGEKFDGVEVVASGRIPESLRRITLDGGAREQLAASDDPDAEAKFWDGFVAGVRAYLAPLALGMGLN